MRIAIAAVLLAATAPAMAQAVAPAGASACSGCHGAGTAVPALRGQRAEDITAAMQAFRTGERPATVMDRIAKGFTDEETRAIAAWVTQQR